MYQPRQQAGYAPSEYPQYPQALTGIPGMQVPFPAHPQQLQPMPPGSIGGGIGLPMPEQALSRPMQAGVKSFQHPALCCLCSLCSLTIPFAEEWCGVS